MRSFLKPQVATYDDACAADPQHYIALYEDDYIRVLRVRYGPHEASAMHGHPSILIIPLNSSKLRRTDSRGHTDVINCHAWHAMQMPIGAHGYENLVDTPFEAIVIESKYATHTQIPDPQRRH
jgi:hypothetical protein